MEAPRLKLFRRHSADCDHKPPYPKEFRIYEADVQKRKGQKPVEDCNCVISAEGTLVKPDGRKEYLRPKATGQHTWTGAHQVADQWQQWGGTQSPVEEYTNPVEELVTMEAAANEFPGVKANQKVSEDTVNSNESLVNDRLLPFAFNKGITHIQQMDNAQIWSDFRSSWTSHHIHVKAPNLPLHQSTENRFVEHDQEHGSLLYRSFLVVVRIGRPKIAVWLSTLASNRNSRSRTKSLITCICLPREISA